MKKRKNKEIINYKTISDLGIIIGIITLLAIGLCLYVISIFK